MVKAAKVRAPSFAARACPEERSFLRDAFKACARTRSWNALTHTTSPRALRDMYASMDMRMHSGYTVAWTVSQLRFIALHGMRAYSAACAE